MRWLHRLRLVSVAGGYLLSGRRITLCALAWENCGRSQIAWRWVRLFGVNHCLESWEYEH